MSLVSIVPIDDGGVIQGIDDQVEIAIVVEVHISSAVADCMPCQSPVFTDIGEGEVMVVVKKIICFLCRGHVLHELPHLHLITHFLGLPCGIARCIFYKIQVGHVPQDAVGDKEVFPAVVVKVGEERGPAPVCIGYAGHLAYFAEHGNAGGVEAVVQLEGIAHLLVMEAMFGPHSVFIVGVGTAQELLPVIVFRQHVHNSDIGQSVIVVVRDVRTHREFGNMARSFGEDLFKCAVVVVEIHEVPLVVIVGNVYIGPAIVIYIADGDAEPEVETAAIDVGLFADVGEMPVVVAIEPIAEFGMSFGPQLFRIEERVEEHVGMIHHEHVQVTIMVHIEKGYGRGVGARGVQSECFGFFLEGGNAVLYTLVDI